MKVLIAAYSETGNTLKVAEAICEETRSLGHEADLCTVAQVVSDDLNQYDLVFLGSACHSADLAQPAKQLLASVPPSPTFKLAGFDTHSTFTAEGGERQRELYEQWASRGVVTLRQFCEEREVVFLGYFGCQGAPSPPIEEFIHNRIVTDDVEWASYIDDVRRHPTQQDLNAARSFARDVLAKC